MRLVKHRGKWALSVKGVRRSTGLDATPENRDFAERKARQIINDAIKATIKDDCASIIEAYIADMPNRAVPKQPSESMQFQKKPILSFFGRHKPHEVTREECRAYIKQRRDAGRADGTIRKELSILSAALRWRDKNTSAIVEMPAAAEPIDEWLTREQFQKLLDAAELDHVKTFLHVAICTGARKEAILTMRWDTHINFEQRTIWPGFKAGGKRRAKPIPMTESAHKWLAAAYERRESGFVVEWAGEQVKDIRRALRAAYERVGLGHIKRPAHVLRHTAGSWMAMGEPSLRIKPAPMLEISRRLGHSSIKTTERVYAHLHPDYMGASTAALEV